MSGDEVRRILGEYKIQVDGFLEIFFSQLKENKNGRYLDALESLENLTLRGGDRVRAAMFNFGYASFEPPTQEVIKASMSIELLQSYFLIHDDIIDDDSIRRGEDTIHVEYQKEYKNKKKGRDFAMLVGDLGTALVHKPIRDTDFPINNINKAIALVDEFVLDVIEGQILDLDLKINPLPTEQEIFDVYKLKTGSYTIDGPLRCGAVLANNTNVDALSEYGVPLGIAYQLRDDIRGIFNNNLDKPIGSDLRQGKPTLLIIKALEKGNTTSRKTIEQNLNNENPDLETVKEIIVETKSLDYSIEKIDGLVDQSLNALGKLELRPEGRDFLHGFAEYIKKTSRIYLDQKTF